MNNGDLQDLANSSKDGNTTTSINETLNPEVRETYETIVAVLFLMLTIIIALLGNTAVISVVCLQRSMRKDISNLLIINLSVTDLSNTVFVMCSALAALISDRWVFGPFWCDCVCAINYCLIIVSMLTLCCISVDRHQAIMHPLSYTLRITRRRMVYIIIYTWVQGILFGTAPSISKWVSFDYWEAICAIQWHSNRPDSIIYVVLAFLLCFLVPGMVLIYCYAKILKEVKKQKARVTFNTNDNQRMQEKNKRKVNDRSKLVWSLLVVVLAYFICTTPFSVTKLIKVISTSKEPIPGPINLVSALLGYVASAINPLIYGIFRRDFRKAYKHLFYSLIMRRSSTQTQSSDFLNSGINTISQANHVTIHQENANEKEQLQFTLQEIKKSSDLLKHRTCSTAQTKSATNNTTQGEKLKPRLSEISEQEHDSNTGAIFDDSQNSPRNQKESRAISEGAISCRQVLVKSVDGCFDQI